MCQRTNSREDEKLLCCEWKWKYSIPNRGGAAKAVLQEKFIVVLKKNLKSVTFQVQKLEKEGQTEPKTDSWKEIKTRTEVMKQRREKRQKNVSKPKLVLQSCQQNWQTFS